MGWNLLYATLLVAVSPMVIYRRWRYGRYRRGAAVKFFGIDRSWANRATGGRRCRWIHAVSVGEVNLLVPLVERLDREEPGTPNIITTSTDTGYDLAVKWFGRERVSYAPLDFSWAIGRTHRSLRCKQLVLTELELWPNLIATSHRRKVPIVVVNGRLNERSAGGYRRFGWFLRRTFARLDHVGCIGPADARRFVRCGAHPASVRVTGSLKFDNVTADRRHEAVQRLCRQCGVTGQQMVWVAGSTGPGEEVTVLDVYRQLREESPNLRLIIVPRHRERFDEVARTIEAAGFLSRRQTQFNSAGDEVAADRQWSGHTVILGDTIGELKYWWGVGTIALVGGSFGNRGGQNMIEPAAYGNAVCYGPRTHNFRDVVAALESADAAHRVHNRGELETFVRRCLHDPEFMRRTGTAARRVVREQRGALGRTVRLVRMASGKPMADDLPTQEFEQNPHSVSSEAA